MILDQATRDAFVSEHKGWALEGETITKTFQFPDFPDAIAFVTRVGFLAEKADHHPDLDIRWNKVTVALTTHSAKGLTQKDTDLASEIEATLRSES